MQQTRRKGIGLVFPALSAGVFSSVKKGPLAGENTGVAGKTQP